jgi:hypothetical protein
LFEYSRASLIVLDPGIGALARQERTGTSLGDECLQRAAYELFCVRKCSAFHGFVNLTRRFIGHFELKCSHSRDGSIFYRFAQPQRKRVTVRRLPARAGSLVLADKHERLRQSLCREFNKRLEFVRHLNGLAFMFAPARRRKASCKIEAATGEPVAA